MAINNQFSIAVTTVRVDELTPSEIGDTVRELYEAEFGEPPDDPGGWYRPDEWRRTSFVLEQLQSGTRVLDVGAGAGNFANMLAASGKFDSVAALDHLRFKKYREYFDSIVRYDASIDELPFEDDHFDVVTCMEVLEHVPDDMFLPGLAELRRVCSGQLLISVPFQEQVPVSRGHLRRFEPWDIAKLFPDAQLTLLLRPRMPWMVIEERLDGGPFTSRAPGERLDLSTLTPDQHEIQRLQAEIRRLRSRRSLRLANFAGRLLRSVRHQIRAGGSGQ